MTDTPSREERTASGMAAGTVNMAVEWARGTQMGEVLIAELFALRAEVERLTKERNKLQRAFDAFPKHGYCKCHDAIEPMADRLRVERELLVEAGRWARYEGFWRLADKINQHLGGTFMGWEHIPPMGPDDEPWVSETEENLELASERLRVAREAIEKAPHGDVCDCDEDGTPRFGRHNGCDCWKREALERTKPVSKKGDK